MHRPSAVTSPLHFSIAPTWLGMDQAKGRVEPWKVERGARPQPTHGRIAMDRITQTTLTVGAEGGREAKAALPHDGGQGGGGGRTIRAPPMEVKRKAGSAVPAAGPGWAAGKTRAFSAPGTAADHGQASGLRGASAHGFGKALPRGSYTAHIRVRDLARVSFLAGAQVSKTGRRRRTF